MAKKMSWDQRFMEMAELVSSWSKDTSTKVGCVIVGPGREIVSVGYNGMPRGIDDSIDERNQRPEKYYWYEHSERNALYNALRVGRSVHDCTLYVTWFPCCDCARGIIQAGIKKLVHKPTDFELRKEVFAFHKSKEMLHEAGVETVSLG